jgi:hypothetical protein
VSAFLHLAPGREEYIAQCIHVQHREDFWNVESYVHIKSLHIPEHSDIVNGRESH